jgi:hypothetical protein
MAAIIKTMATKNVRLGPNFSDAQPLIKSPMIPPAEEPFPRPDCQAAGMMFFPSGPGTPNFAKKLGCP